MNYRTIADLNNIILKRLYILPHDFDLIVGIPRSGMLPANLLALYLNKPYTDIDSFINGYIYGAGERSQFFKEGSQNKVLVVDDSITSGAAMEKAKAKLKGLSDRFTFKYCVVYLEPGKENKVDYYFEGVPLPRYFQWNIFNHTILEKACFDIDGVLCMDPAPEQNDDGVKYIDFILNASPLYVPGSKIGVLVTSRLEKYRKETETWLQKNNVKYGQLIMLDLPDREARMKANCHARHKADVYKSVKYNLFVESSLSQALEINAICKKPVFCTENFEMIFDSKSFIYSVKSGRRFSLLRKTFLYFRDKKWKKTH